MKAPHRLLPLLLLLSSGPLFSAGEAEQALLDAAAKGDAPRIVLALSEAPADTRDKEGRTPLMLAAKVGDFESVRRLLWGGANAALKDNQGKMARDFLDPEGEAYAPLTLILRCYAFCKEYARPGGPARVPHLALINDNWVDPSHPDLAPHYVINTIEKDGKGGVDDDKNGFIDDIFGWNLQNDEPLRAPQLSIDNSPETRTYLENLMKDFLAANEGDEKIASILSGRYQNPLVRQIGFGTLAGAEIDLNDLAYANMLYSASHGTHVAGIITRFSENKAKIHGAAIGMTTPPSGRVFSDLPGVVKLAQGSPDYASFIVGLIDRYRGEAIAKGRRSSDYLRACGAGVANMSWGRPRPWFEGISQELANIYREHGKNPKSVDAPPPAASAQLLANLPLELTIADAAAFALAFYENPDVLVVIAAGNESEDNDEMLPSPQYLSRFFPNVMTVASVDGEGKPSEFTNVGVRSVQIAATGEDIDSTVLAHLRAPMSGTSMASPVVAGTAAGIRADFPALGASDVRRLLEASARRSDALAKVCSTSGVLDADAARTMAASWSRDNLAMLVEEVRRAKVPGRDGPKIKVPQLASAPVEEPKRGPNNQPAPDAEEEGGVWRISGVAGFGQKWRVVMSQDTGFTDQMHLGLGPWPGEEVEDAWSKGYRITSISGDQDTWNVVMSRGVEGNQSVYGYTLDQAQIAASMKEGFRITHAAGWKDRWLVVMDTDTGMGEQRYTLPTPLNDSRRDWISKRWEEGYRITAVAGDDVAEDAQDGWLFVMSQKSGLTDQKFAGPGPWPTDWIEERKAEGYRITSVAGVENRTIVVVSKGSDLGDQDVSAEGAYPNGWIKERW
jgi:subtilisin family serine protease